MSQLKTTPLYDWHQNNGAKIISFAGWQMPVQYQGILEEHKHTRTQASIFDISHMGQFIVEGPGTTMALEQIMTHNLSTLKPGRCRYGFLLNEQGGILDDLVVYRLEDEKYMLVVNAACIDSDFSWISAHLPEGLTLINKSSALAKIDLQGPQAYEVLKKLMPGPWATLGFFAFHELIFDGYPLLISRTGYTGELGYEFYLPWEKAASLWIKLLAMDNVLPAGLGARDTLRLEVGLPLYGQDLDPEHTPVEAGYAAMLTSKAEYIGKAALDTVRQRLIGLRIDGRRSARPQDLIYLGSNQVGVITSGSIAPTLGYCIALGYVQADLAHEENFIIHTPRTTLPATRADLPFYTQGTVRTSLT